MDRFDVASVSASGGMIGICPIPGRAGDYAGDLAAILGWAPDLVLTMTTPEELRRTGAAGFGATLRAQGLGWRHLPITDLGAPAPATARLWPAASAHALAILHGGGRVLVHCYGGCGRSGMAVLRLMVEAGERPDTALRRLRAVRPCAVETSQQMAWATAGKPDRA